MILVDTFVDISIHAPARGATHDVTLSTTFWRISIHAPARGATHRPTGLVRQKFISIHAPARGATWNCLRKRAICGHFNPRSREGSDKPAARATHSIHNFNPRSREGSDCDFVAHVWVISVFQSTLPRGERQYP